MVKISVEHLPGTRMHALLVNGLEYEHGYNFELMKAKAALIHGMLLDLMDAGTISAFEIIREDADEQ